MNGLQNNANEPTAMASQPFTVCNYSRSNQHYNTKDRDGEFNKTSVNIANSKLSIPLGRSRRQSSAGQSMRSQYCSLFDNFENKQITQLL